MTELEKYEAVNSAESVEELKAAMRLCADGALIEGRERAFDVERMCEGLDMYINEEAPPNVLTRKWGIRQQAMYIKFYEKY